MVAGEGFADGVLILIGQGRGDETREQQCRWNKLSELHGKSPYGNTRQAVQSGMANSQQCPVLPRLGSHDSSGSCSYRRQSSQWKANTPTCWNWKQSPRAG